MTSKRSKLRDDTHFRVLQLLQNNPEMSQRELARIVGASLGSMHSILNAMIDDDLVTLRNFTGSKDMRRYAYVLTPNGLSRKTALTRAFLIRKIEEYEALKQEIEALSSELEIGELEAGSKTPSRDEPKVTQ